MAPVVQSQKSADKFFGGCDALNKSKHPSSSLYALGFLMQRQVMYSRVTFRSAATSFASLNEIACSKKGRTLPDRFVTKQPR